MAEASVLNLPSDLGRQGNFRQGSVHFIGTATVLFRYAGFTILTDPNFLHRGDHVHLGYGMTSQRLTEPAMNIEDLPPLDLVVLSHYHGDHFDRIAEARLDKNVPILTTQHAATALRKLGFRAVQALETWNAITVLKDSAQLRVTAMPGKHGPGPVNFLLPPVMGSMLEFQPRDRETALRLYITGDTLMHADLQEIPRRYPQIDLALVHLGGTRILGLMLTMDAEQGVEMIRLIKPQKAVPIHYNDYEVFKSSIGDFMRAVDQAGLTERIIYLRHGETYEFEVPESRYGKNG